MPSRLLNFRLAFAGLGAALLLVGGLADFPWAALPGVLSCAVSEFIGLAQSNVRFDKPIERTFRGSTEALPSLGLAAFEPLALGIAMSVVVYAIMANGMLTVGTARGRKLTRQAGETVRRLIGALAGMAVLMLPVRAMTDFRYPDWLATEDRALVAVAVALVTLAGLRALLDMSLELRKAPER